MNAAFWDLFGSDYTENCLRWERLKAPVLPPSGEEWQSRWTANPDFLAFRGRTFLYYRGNGEIHGRPGLHDRIGGAEVLRLGPGELELKPLNGGRFLVDAGPDGSFDGRDALDPATVVFQDKVWLYYSAVGAGEDSVGLAVSDDGERFEKVGRIMTGRAPDVLVRDGRIVMIYQLPDENGNYRPYLAQSEDGHSFSPVVNEPLFPRSPDTWDSLSFVTARLLADGDTFYVLYGGSSYLADEPDFFGLARSQDLVHWETHPGNPIFGCGAKGSPDGGAIWFPALTETEDAYVLLYEGSRGKYRWDLSSAICMAWLPKGTALRS